MSIVTSQPRFSLTFLRQLGNSLIRPYCLCTKVLHTPPPQPPPAPDYHLRDFGGFTECASQKMTKSEFFFLAVPHFFAHLAQRRVTYFENMHEVIACGPDGPLEWDHAPVGPMFLVPKINHSCLAWRGGGLEVVWGGLGPQE